MLAWPRYAAHLVDGERGLVRGVDGLAAHAHTNRCVCMVMPMYVCVVRVHLICVSIYECVYVFVCRVYGQRLSVSMGGRKSV